MGVVVGGGLPRRIGRVAYDDANGSVLLVDDPGGVLGKDFAEKLRPFGVFPKLSSVRQADALKGHITYVFQQIMEGVFNVDAGDVIGKQHYLVGVKLLGVLSQQIFPA